MSNIVHFTPRPEWDAKQNQIEFVRMCREELTLYGEDLDWESNYWKEAGVIFAKFGERTPRGKQPNPLSQPFLDFAKAYLRYTHSINATKGKETSGFRALEMALFNKFGNSDLNNITNEVFDDAQELGRQEFSISAAANCASELAKLAEFLNTYKLIPVALDWKRSISKPQKKNRTGKAAKEEREKRLPNDESLLQLADLFGKELTNSRDILTTSVVAMLMCAPSRITEILALRADAQVWEKDKDGKEQYGWRFQAGKGGIHEIKWIPDTMAKIGQKAFSRILKLTDDARKLAKFYESNDTDFYKHDGTPDVAPDQPLSWEQAALAMGYDIKNHYNKSKPIETYCHDLFRQAKYDTSIQPTLRTLRSFINEKKTPKGFPFYDKDRNIKYSEALFCTLFYELKASVPRSPVRLAAPISRQQVNHDLVSDSGNTHCIFARHNLIDLNGNAIKFTTHQFRHLLNTLAQQGGLSQYQIARWSGRADVKQNVTYDHMTEYELVSELAKVGTGVDYYGPEVDLAKQLPVSIQEYNSLTIPTAHVTELGFCTLDWTMEPCQKFRDCINCTEQVCIKGDKRKERIKTVHEMTVINLEKARAAANEEAYGADRHVEHLELTEVRLRQLLSIMNDPSIPDGSVVRLRNDKEFIPTRIAAQQRIESNNKKDDDLLNDLIDFLGE